MTRSLRSVLTVALSLTSGLLLATAGPAAATNGLRFIEVQKKAGADGRPLNGARGVAVSPDAKHVYVASRNDDAVLVFARNAANGTLTLVETHKHQNADGTTNDDGLNGANAIAVSPDGKHVYVGSDIDDCLVAFARNPDTGALTFLHYRRDGAGLTNGIDGAESVIVSPDGLHVYVAGAEDNAVAFFSRNVDTGFLTFIDKVKQGVDGAFGLLSAKSLAMSSDGLHVYTAASADDAVTSFTRDPATGRLTQLETLYNNDNGVTGIDKPRGVAMSPDGKHLYVTGGIDDALAVFGRDAATGLLTQIQVSKNRVDGVRGLNGSNKVAVSPDGQHVYTTADVDDAVTVFVRNPATGEVAFAERLHDGSNNVDGLNDAWGVAVSPDNMTVYVTGYVDDAITVFRKRLCGDSIKDPTETCDDGNTADGDCCNAACAYDAAGVACASDDNACTDDICNGSGTCSHENNAAPCDDGAFCTEGDVCTNGTCRGATPRDCSAAGDQCNSGVCDEALDACAPQAMADGTACNDGVNCTRPDACVAGVCTGTPVSCAIADACHDGGSCTEATGLCPNARPDGTPCNDDDACTRTDACSLGLCTGSDAVVCTAADQCHTAGTCNTTTGVCSNPAKVNGTPCNDGSRCTNGDTCQTGICSSGTAVVCTASDQCHAAGVCNPSTGTCSNPTQPEGATCNDGDAMTSDDICSAGVCTGTPLPDSDGDGVVDPFDVCPEIADADQTDSNANGVGDACECSLPAPGRCVTGGGPAKTDCLLEFNTRGPVTPNKKRTGVLGVLRCKDGDVACDRDGVVDGTCTFGVALCLGNADPRITACRPGAIRNFEVVSPNADKARTPLDRANALSLEEGLGTLGIEIRRAGKIVTAFSASKSQDMCSTLLDVTVPAPAGAKPSKRTFKMRGTAVDGRVDLDKLTLECIR